MLVNHMLGSHGLFIDHVLGSDGLFIHHVLGSHGLFIYHLFVVVHRYWFMIILSGMRHGFIDGRSRNLWRLFSWCRGKYWCRCRCRSWSWCRGWSWSRYRSRSWLRLLCGRSWLRLLCSRSWRLFGALFGGLFLCRFFILQRRQLLSKSMRNKFLF